MVIELHTRNASLLEKLYHATDQRDLMEAQGYTYSAMWWNRLASQYKKQLKRKRK